MKKLTLLLLFFGLFIFAPAVSDAQNNDMFKGKHKYKHRSRRESKNKTAYNPYIDHDTNKSKKLATKEMTKDDKRVQKHAKKQIRREKRKLRRTKGAYQKVKKAK